MIRIISLQNSSWHRIFSGSARKMKAGQLAEEVYNKDKYNIMAYNLVSLHDHLSTFTTLQSGKFIVRMDKKEAIAYGDDVVDLLENAENNLCKKYGVKLENPTILEIFSGSAGFCGQNFR